MTTQRDTICIARAREGSAPASHTYLRLARAREGSAPAVHKGQESQNVHNHSIMKTTQDKIGQSFVLPDTNKTQKGFVDIYSCLARAHEGSAPDIHNTNKESQNEHNHLVMNTTQDKIGQSLVLPDTNKTNNMHRHIQLLSKSPRGISARHA